MDYQISGQYSDFFSKFWSADICKMQKYGWLTISRNESKKYCRHIIFHAIAIGVFSKNARNSMCA
jgi:hypothetical protein